MKDQKKMSEKRQERKNETIIMGKLEEMAVDLAVIKTESKNTSEHLKTLNGKVATQEGRQQSIDSSVQLVTQTIQSQQKQIDSLLQAKSNEDNKKLTFWERNADKLFWTVIVGIALMYLSTKIH